MYNIDVHRKERRDVAESIASPEKGDGFTAFISTQRKDAPRDLTAGRGYFEMAEFNDRLKEAMRKKGIRQMDLSRLTGIPKSAISQYVSGKFTPRADRLELMAETLGVSTAQLLGFDGMNELTPEEQKLISVFRTDEAFASSVRMLLGGRTVFRAAKSDDGSIMPSIERVEDEELERLANAPETDEDF